MTCTLLRFDKWVCEFKCEHAPRTPPRLRVIYTVPFVSGRQYFLLHEAHVSTYVLHGNGLSGAGGNAHFHNNSNKDHLFYFCFIEVNLAGGCSSNEQKIIPICANHSQYDTEPAYNWREFSGNTIRSLQHFDYASDSNGGNKKWKKNRLRYARRAINFPSYRKLELIRFSFMSWRIIPHAYIYIYILFRLSFGFSLRSRFIIFLLFGWALRAPCIRDHIRKWKQHSVCSSFDF